MDRSTDIGKEYITSIIANSERVGTFLSVLAWNDPDAVRTVVDAVSTAQSGLGENFPYMHDLSSAGTAALDDTTCVV